MKIDRISSIDIVRGIVMIIMALDHTRDLIHVSSITHQPTDLTNTTSAIFLTRWITHLCAPTFVFLSGVSAYNSFTNKNNIANSRRHLLLRGIFLIVLDLSLINFGVWFDIHFSVILFDVLSAIGFGFIVLSLFLNSSTWIIGIIGLSIIFFHNLIAFIPFAEESIFKKILMPFFAPGAFSLGPNTTFVMGYPPIPWVGIMLSGFAAGLCFTFQSARRKDIFLKFGISSLLLFIILRFTNVYGDPSPWHTQNNFLFTFFSFINVTKYPPSLQFCLVTLGIMFLLLYFVDGAKNILTDISTVFGKVPMFYFIIHWFIIHPIMFAIIFLQGYKPHDLLFGFNFGRPKGPSGVELWAIYLIWLAVVIILFPICKWYGNYKEKHREKRWLSYL